MTEYNDLFIKAEQLQAYKNLTKEEQLEISFVVAKIYKWLQITSPSEFLTLHSSDSLELIKNTQYPQITKSCFHAQRLGVQWH